VGKYTDTNIHLTGAYGSEGPRSREGIRKNSLFTSEIRMLLVERRSPLYL
jgi:hypothetical protein